MDTDDAMDYFDFAKYSDDGDRQQTCQVCHHDGTPNNGGSDPQEPPSTDPFLSSDDDASQSMEWDLAKAARHDYFSIDPMQAISLPLTPPGSEDALMEPFTQLPPTFGEEKWNVDRETAQFLSSVMSPISPSEETEHDAHLGFRKFKVDEPLLSTDPIVDIQRLHERNAVCVTTAGMEPFVLSKKKDERLTWDKRSLKLPHQVEKEIAAEKVVVDGETASFLKEVFQDMEGPAILPEDCRTKAAVTPVSPPLLPLSPPFSPQDILSQVEEEVPLTSTPEDLNLGEAARLEAQIMDQDDVEARANPTVSDNLDTFSSPSQRKVRRLDELKISSPLLPLDPTEPPTKKAKTVAFSDDLASFIPSLESNDADEDPQESAEDVMHAFAEMVAPLADVMPGQAKDEELVEVDTTMRVPVPAVEKLSPAAPWHMHVDNPQSIFQEMKAGLDKIEKQWSGITSLERHLQWNAFPYRLGKPKPEGDFDDGSLARYLAELDIEGDADISSMVCKQDGLRILDPGEDDDLETASGGLDGHTIDLPSRPVSAVQSQLVPALREPAQVERVSHVTERSTKESDSLAPGHQPRLTVPREPLEFSSLDALLKKRKDQLKPNPAGPTATTDTQNLGQGHLSGFLSMQGIAPVASKSSSKTVPVAAEQIPPAQPPNAPPSAPPSTTTHAFPTPSMTHDNSPLPILISTTLLTNRSLIRSLNHHLPTLTLIERDYTTPHPPTPEADLTLSPRTGLTLTTLQRLKQKPLPGTRPDPNHPTFRTHLAVQALRYETLLVFITHPTPSPTHPLSPRDAEALVDFTLFTTTSIPNTDVQVSLIPLPPGEDGTDVLAQWIAAAIVRYAPRLDPGMTVLQDETLWERWLRRAGMNAFAAQVVLDLVKGGKGKDDRESERDGSGDSSMGDGGWEGGDGGAVTGLAAFVMMGKEERTRRFAAAMGGTRVLERVGRVVDGRWRGGGGGVM